MLLKPTVAALAAALATVAAPVPAQADDLAAVNGCRAVAPPNHGRGECVFVGLAGTYVIEINSDVRYAWARLYCDNREVMFVDAWDTDGYHDVEVDDHQGDLCRMEVAAGSVLTGNPGNFGAIGHVYRVLL